MGSKAEVVQSLYPLDNMIISMNEMECKMKYHNKKCFFDGRIYDSKLEARRSAELDLLVRAGKIRALERQKSFVLQEGYINNKGQKIRPITYVADFCYWDVDEDCMVVEDAKGFANEVYKIKKKMFEKRYPDIDFREIKKPR